MLQLRGKEQQQYRVVGLLLNRFVKAVLRSVMKRYRIGAPEHDKRALERSLVFSGHGLAIDGEKHRLL